MKEYSNKQRLVKNFSTPKTILKIEELLSDCEEKQLYGEIKGILFYDNKKHNLTFTEVQSESQKKINQCLDKHIDGDFSHLEDIIKYAQKVISIKEGDLDIEIVVKSILGGFRGRNESKKEREWHVRKFREYILSNHTEIDVNKLPLDEPGFVGFYHIHTKGSPPSKTDINSTKNLSFPNFLISKTEQGFDIYSIFHSKVDKLLSHSNDSLKEEKSPK